MFLPINRQEMQERDWHYLDFLLVCGDAYVDHPSFGMAIIGRYLEDLGFRIGILPQPDLQDEQSFLAMGRPRYGVLVTAGNLDSRLAHYTSNKNRRKTDLYSPGGRIGLRPDYASVAYARRAKKVFGQEMPVILGGVEASLRRFVHYDFWLDRILPSVLMDSGADLLVYGMGELAIGAVAQALKKGGLSACQEIPGVAFVLADANQLRPDDLLLPSFEEARRSKQQFASACYHIHREQNFFDGKRLVQPHGKRFVVTNRPMRPLTEAEMDAIYALPFERAWHPSYDALGGVPAFDEVRFSITSHRGCFGGCHFCAIGIHQGRIIQSRSAQSILQEARVLIQDKAFKGYIHDVGGPTANFRGQTCEKARKSGPCRDRACAYPKICSRLPKDSSEYEALLTDLRRLSGVKKVFIRSGLRFDYALAEKSRSFLHTLCRYHISGQLKVAPEHMSPQVLAAMGKPAPQVYRDFIREFKEINRKLGKEQYLVPYFMASHPGSRLEDAIVLAECIRDWGVMPQQVQDFIPTPGTISTCMYVTGIDPRTMKPIYLPKSDAERNMQRALLQFRKPQHQAAVRAALLSCGRKDLIGSGKHCLVPAEGGKPQSNRQPKIAGMEQKHKVQPSKQQQHNKEKSRAKGKGKRR